ncbi:MAG: TIGR04076 family protein [Candidatus Lindowbacteria bacterium]|nr:TIGR04076 family protein [Candidatus Lindowbacteria bacterium]
MHKVKVTVKSVKGNCAAGYKVGDYFLVEDPMLIPAKPEALCIYAIPAFIPYLTAYCRETPSEDWINRKKELQCPDSTNTVVFSLERLP